MVRNGIPDPDDTAVCSVVVPTRDRRALLERAVRCIRAQTAPCEVVVAVDGSTDDTVAWIERLADPAIVHVDLPSQAGVAHARNVAIAAGGTALVAFCDDDDLWAPGKIAAQIDAMEATERPWCCTTAVHVTPDFAVLAVDRADDDDWFHRRIPHSNPVPGGCSSVVVERELLARVGGFDTQLSLLADWELWMRCYELAGPPATVIEPMVLYTVHPDQMTRDLSTVRWELDALRQAHAALRASAPDAVDEIDYWIVRTLIASGQWAEAMRYARTSASRSGGAALTWAAQVGRSASRLLRRGPGDEASDDVRRTVQLVRELLDGVVA